jgi:hypothetical protein
LWLWLYSSANVWGSVAGLIGVALFFAGVIGPGWLAIVAGLYAIGAVAAPRPRRVEFAIGTDYTLEDVQQHLDAMLKALQQDAGDATLATLKSIRDHALTLLPQLRSEALTEEDRYLLRETIVRYLPDTIANYLRLPTLYRRYHVVRGGKTAEALLHEQLSLMDEQLSKIADRVYQAQAQALVVQGRFLEDKFRKPDLIGSPPGGTDSSR